MTDYSQSGEQAPLLRWANGRGNGKLLDIGAADGLVFSNSRALIESGWAAVLVEPAAWAADKLLALYNNRPDVVVVNALVMAEQAGLVELFYSRDDLLSTTHPAERQRWASQVNFESCWCAAVTLRELLDRFGPFDLASIDAEGETEALVEAYAGHSHWDSLRCLCFEVAEVFDMTRLERRGWQRLVQTTNNVVMAR